MSKDVETVTGRAGVIDHNKLLHASEILLSLEGEEILIQVPHISYRKTLTLALNFDTARNVSDIINKLLTRATGDTT